MAKMSRGWRYKACDLRNKDCYGFDCGNRTCEDHCIQIVYTYRGSHRFGNIGPGITQLYSVIFFKVHS